MLQGSPTRAVGNSPDGISKPRAMAIVRRRMFA